MDSLALLGANGIFGVGLFLKDCGSLCAANTTTMYYDCAGHNVSLKQPWNSPRR